ncbi:histone-lysine N-methyltransferase SETDB2-like isoform X2 [Parambassis ranga]|uniref:Histone-lysine N-methyltransferase SETDB2 n=1 Tax=Parambassis ranga TaxID=210632 RepID=A0A6P7HIY1_9TELE|nr:histone-lysine N-methyltransferase SETDB2-like isoform X2 [Parambassis ranga]
MMNEMGDSVDSREAERAKAFWSEEDVEQVFSGVFLYLDHLKGVLKRNTATDREYVQAFRLLESLGCTGSASPQDQDSSVVQVVIGSDELLPAPSPPCSSAASPAGREELLPPLTPVQLQYELHTCSKVCLPGLPSMPQSTPLFWGQNPLRVPLLCRFKRLSGLPMMSPPRVGLDHEEVEEDEGGWDVVYKAPCGLSLRDYEDVMRFLLATESYDVLQVDFFTFNPSVRLDPPHTAGPRRPEQDLSRGLEPTPVELCVGEGGARPPDFRYRKDRWPHGCFLSRDPGLFKTCCDCTDGCSSAERCACVAMTTGGHHYSHHRLLEPVPSGLFECGPWCGCDRARCQNRLVQRGIRVRLQVFQTEDRGWGVRCRDDLDVGTFVCIYAGETWCLCLTPLHRGRSLMWSHDCCVGVVLQRVLTHAEPPPPKLTRIDLPSDDEVEVVTEWLAPPVLEGRSDLLETPPPTSPPLHVPVIQRPSDAAATPQDRDKTVLVGAPRSTPPAADFEGENGKAASGTKLSVRRAAAKVEDVCFLDASKEGNVSRFLNHSCQPNLFIQNVFTDSHDPGFPVIAFFTSRALKAGTELTWNYSADAHPPSQQEQEVPCLCRSGSCQGRFTVEEKLCGSCEAGVQ